MVGLIHYHRFELVIVSPAPDCGVERHLGCWNIPTCLYELLCVCGINMNAFSISRLAHQSEKLISLLLCWQQNFERRNCLRAFRLWRDSTSDAHH